MQETSSWLELQPMLEQAAPGRLHPVVWTHAGSVLEACGQDPMLEQFLKDCSPWEGPHNGGGAEVEKKVL